MSQPEPNEEALWAGWIVLAPMSPETQAQAEVPEEPVDEEEINVDECCF